MTQCSLDAGMTLEFPRSNVVVKPRKGDVRNKRRHYTHGNFELSHDDGTRVAAFVEEWEPVTLVIDGVKSYRFVIPPDAVKFKYDLEETEKAELTLVDSRKVLQREEISKQWDSVSFEEAVDYILSNRKDEHRVIEEARFVNGTKIDEHEVKVTKDVAELPFGADDIEDSVVRFIDTLRTDVFLRESFADEMFFGFDFDGVSPLTALERVTQEFGVGWWVDRRGTLWFGEDMSFGEVIGTAANNDNIVLKRYSLTENARTTSAVHVQSSLSAIAERKLLTEYSNSAQVIPERLKIIGEANHTEIDGSLDHFEMDSPVDSPKEIERAAGRLLIDEIMKDVAGSVQINGMASESVDEIARLRVGDKFIVDSSIKDKCEHNEDVVTGFFIINSVHHRFDTRRGWEITAKVSRDPNASAIETSSVLYDPLVDKEYDSFAAYEPAQQ